MKIISLINPKGGAGKTVSAINIAYALKNQGYDVLLIDTDPRGAIATYFDIDKRNSNTVFELIQSAYDNLGIVNNLQEYLIEKNGVDIIISDDRMAGFEAIFDEKSEELEIFKEMKKSFSNYDYVVVDTEGTVNATVRSVLHATDYIFVPTKASYIDTNGVADLKQMYEIVKNDGNSKIKLEKIFIVQAEENTKVFKNTHRELDEIFEIIKNDFGKNPYSKRYIRKSAGIVNAMEEHKDIFTYRKSNSAAIDYKNLVYEFLEENGE